MEEEELVRAAESSEVTSEAAELSAAGNDFDSLVDQTLNEEKTAREEALNNQISKINNKAVDTQKAFQDALDPNNPIPREDMKEMFDEANKVQTMNSARDAVTAGENLSTDIESTASRVADTTQASSKTVMEKVNALAKKNLSKSEYAEYQDTMTEHENNLQQLADDLKNKKDTKESEQDVNRTGEKIQRTLEKENISDEIESSVGRRKSVVKEIMKYSRLLKYLAGPAGLWAFLYYVSKQLTGCYKYSGLDSEKITCSKTPFQNGTCGCGDAQEGIDNAAKLAKYCDQNTKFSNYPFCCPPTTPDRPTCSGKPGEKNAIYYAWHEFTPASIVAGLPGDIAKLANAVESGISGLLQNMIKWVLYVILILVILYILFVIGKHFLSKAMSSSKNNKFHYKSK